MAKHARYSSGEVGNVADVDEAYSLADEYAFSHVGRLNGCMSRGLIPESQRRVGWLCCRAAGVARAIFKQARVCDSAKGQHDGIDHSFARSRSNPTMATLDRRDRKL
ncbi:predicted protein [Histoplasma capsulatum H143]|uniref:Uncharacterized protein n=1 Tax=Ajellomyces capsulatus (strain H143) TaxID=544712 RepID=C6HEE3_AJECH|nr:predicted protein [Histoplasma capsulatum H143]